MDIRELKYFLIVAKEQNLTKAAEYLYITQPSLTRQIQNLEREVGSPLFLRTGKKMILTETGLFLKKRAEEIVALYDKTQSELTSPIQDISGDVYIGSGETYSFSTIVNTMKEVNTNHPDIHFHVHSGNTDDVIEKLDKGLIDFGVLVEPCDLTKYEFLRLPLADVWGILMRKDDPLANNTTITFEQLQNLPLITSKHIYNDSTNQIYRLLNNPNIIATYNLIYNASLMVKSGMGYVIGLDGLINTKESDLLFIPLEPKTVSFINIAWKKHQVFSKASKVFLQTLQKHLIHYNNYSTIDDK